MVDVAHLYEDAHLRLAHFETLIVLCSNHNQAQRRAPSRFRPPIEHIFGTGRLRSIGEQSYLEGNFPRSYAANRLAAYYFEKQGLFSDAVYSLVDAISGTRAYRWAGALIATIREIHRLIKTNEVAPVARWQFLSRLSMALFDYGRWDLAAKVAVAANAFTKRIGSDQRNPQQLKFENDLAFRHGALVRGVTNSLERRETVRSLTKRLIADAHDFHARKDYKGLATNLDITSKLLAEVSGNPDKAHDYSEEALSVLPKLNNTWVIQELHWREAHYFHAKKDQKKTLRSVVCAMNEHSQHPVILEPIADKSGPRARSVLNLVNSLGLTIESVAEAGATISKETNGEQLFLKTSEINEFIRAATV